jgi:hypothetical protein
MSLGVVMLNVVMLNVVMPNVVMLNVVMLNVVMLNVVMLSVIMLSVVAPRFCYSAILFICNIANLPSCKATNCYFQSGIRR